MIDSVFEPFQDALRDFCRAAPAGSKPHTFRIGLQEFSMYGRWCDQVPKRPVWPPAPEIAKNPDKLTATPYHGMTVELVAFNAHLSIVGQTPDGKPVRVAGTTLLND
jgi:hypothetical protein